MPLSPGSRWGSYDVLSRIGEGGMGEVYRARDTRLERNVALKVLPASFAADPDRLMRFEREARTLASLNHPNIAAIYGIEDADGRNALVMELVEGEDLSARIARGPIPLDEALPIARQIADALETAHDAGIIHRDLKPANVKVRSDGTTKVLDFGLAKATDPGNATTPASLNSPTFTSPALTAMGIVLGTAAYMAPEQAKGRVVDRRADIWAFGVVLYEMLTGRRAFSGDDVSEVMAAVLRDTPDLDALPKETPAAIRTLLARCLQKDPAKRLPSIGAARLEITEVLAGSGAAPVPAATGGTSSRSWQVAAAVAMLAAIVFAVLDLRAPAPATPVPLVFTVASTGQIMGVNAVAPNGRSLVFATRAGQDGPGELRVQALDALTSTTVPGSAGARSRTLGFAAWSPDSRSLAFNVGNELRWVDLVTGQASTIVKLPNNLSETVGPGAWGPDNTILYGTNSFETRTNGVWRVSTAGGTPLQVTRVGAGEVDHAPSCFLPDGRHFLYFVERVDYTRTGEIRIGSLDATPDAQSMTPLLVADGPAQFVPAEGNRPASLLFVSRGNLLAQPFDAKTLTLGGTPHQVAPNAGPLVSAAADRLAYRMAGSDTAQFSELVHVDRTGRKLGTLGPPGNYGEINAFADGSRLAVSRTDADGIPHVQIVDIARQLFTRLTPGNATDYADAVSRDGLVAYTSAPSGVAHDIYVRPANGVGDPRLLVSSDTVKHPNDWSPDGRYLIYDDHVPNRAQDLLIVGRDGGKPVPFLTTDADETFGQFSPDGKWIAYRSTESGRAEVYVRDFVPGHVPAYGNEKVQVSVSGGDKPRWSANGRELFYLRPDGMLMAAAVRTGTHFDVDEPSELFQTHVAGYYPYAVLPDGTFYVNTRTNAGDATPLIVVMVDWSAAR